jgi:Mg-chelatase subunit ChlD
MAQVDGRPPRRPADHDAAANDKRATDGETSSTWRLICHRRALPLQNSRSITIGSNPDAGLQLSHHSVSGRHASLVKSGDSFVLKAHDGAKIEVNQRPVDAALLKGGETIRIGDIVLRIERGQVDPSIDPHAKEMSAREEFHRALARELRRAPWYLISLVGHALIVAALAARDEVEPPKRPVAELSAAIDPETSELWRDVTPQDPPLIPPELETTEQELPDVEFAAATESPFELPAELPVDPGEIPLVGAGAGAMTGDEPVRGGLGNKGIDIGKMGPDLARQIESYRGVGLDLVILIDTTSSMDPVLSRARLAIDRIVSDFASLVPQARMGLVAYRDHGDQYVVRYEDLTADRFRILNFLETLDSGGGGDLPEAVYDALEVSFADLSWRKEAHRVVIVVGDAPPHAEDMSKLRLLVNSARRRDSGKVVVSTIHVPRSDADPARIAETANVFAEIAQLGGGDALTLSDLSEVGEQLVVAVIGGEHRAAIVEALQRVARSPRERMVDGYVRERALQKLFSRFMVDEPDPAVIAGLIRLQGPSVAQRCLAVVRDEEAPRVRREAALYILRRCVAFRRALDLSRPIELQREALDELLHAIERTFPRR